MGSTNQQHQLNLNDQNNPEKEQAKEMSRMKKIIIGLVIGISLLAVILTITLILINLKKPTVEMTTLYEYPIPGSNQTLKVQSSVIRQRNFFSANEEYKGHTVTIKTPKKNRLLS